MDRFMPVWVPFSVMLVIAVIVVAVGEVFLRVSPDMALIIGLCLLGGVTLGAFALAGTGGNSQTQQHH